MEGIRRKVYSHLARQILKGARGASSVSGCGVPKVTQTAADFPQRYGASTKLVLPRFGSTFYISQRQYSDKNSSGGNNDSPHKDLLEKDEELRGFLSDIMSDFNDTPPPQPPKNKNSKAQKEEYAVSSKPCELCSTHGGDVPKSAEGQFKVFDETQVEEILDCYEEQDQHSTYLYQEKEDTLQKYKFKRGVEGVFDIEELVSVLQQENADDVAVISVPENLHYCKYLVLVTAKSPRHLSAMSEFINKLYKKKKSEKDEYLIPEGKSSNDWKILDMGHIVLHMFLEPTRAYYDLETLWTVGEEYDDQSHVKEDPVMDLLQQHIQFLDEIEPLSSADKQ